MAQFSPGNNTTSSRGQLLRSCWSPTPTKRPSASEILELLTNNPRLISPCIDVPLASVQIERTDSLELLPIAKKSPTHATIIGTLDTLDGKLNLIGSKASKASADTQGYYSPMHAKLSNGGPRMCVQPPEAPGGDMGGYYRPDTEAGADTSDPLLAGAREDHQLTVGSYVQPGYIYVCDNL